MIWSRILLVPILTVFGLSGCGYQFGSATQNLNRHTLSLATDDIRNSDRPHVHTVTAQALETGKVLSWSNSQTGNSGKVTPFPAFSDRDGSTCRLYGHELYTQYGGFYNYTRRACKTTAGSWSAVDLRYE